MKVKPLQDKVQEPLMVVPKGYGYYGTLLYDEIADKIQCHECGEWVGALSRPHLKKHGLTAREYKIKYELNLTTALQIPSISEKRALTARANFRKMHFKKGNASVVWKKMQKASKRKGKQGNRWTVEMMNRYGTCPKQLEEKFIIAIERLGHTPSATELYKYDMNLYNVLCRRFKGYSNALKHFGLKGKRKAVFKDQYNREIIEEMVQDFVTIHKKVPTVLDTKHDLPGYNTIIRYFGSWNEFKETAFRYLSEKYPRLEDEYNMRMYRTNI